MQQPSVANYFKIKKRIRDEPANSKSAKLVAMSPSAEVAGGLDKPNPIRVADILSSPTPSQEAPTNCPEPSSTLSTVDIDIDRKRAKGKRLVPCYQRYHHLISTPNQEDVDMAAEPSKPISAEPIKTSVSTASINLPLPYKYKLLMEQFRAVETVASIFFNRKEIITFAKMKPAVLELVRSTQLREKHLAQILTVLPNCYTFAYEKISAPGSRDLSYQLIISPNLAATSIPTSDKMTSALIAERLSAFQNSLIDRCHKYHKEFLMSLTPPIVLPPDSQVTRWHPKFALNEIPNIDCSAMPKCPDSGSISATTAKEVIARARNIMEAANPRMRNALQELMKKTAGASINQPGSPPAEAPDTKVPVVADKRAAAKDAILRAQQALIAKAQGNPAMRDALNKVLAKNKKDPIPIPDQGSLQGPPPQVTTSIPEGAQLAGQKGNALNKKTLTALKGVSQSLIDKIRAREQEKAIRCMTLSPQEAKDAAMANRLPDFVKIVQNTMVAEKKSVLALNVVLDRLFHSHYQALSYSEVECHLRLLHKTLPDWFTILKTSQGEFVKINKDMNMNEILERLEGLLKKGK